MDEGRKKAGQSLGSRFLSAVERAGNRLPHPITLFALLSLAVVVISALCQALGVSAAGELVSGGALAETRVEAVSLLTREGLAWMLTSAVTNFTGYVPLGTVLVAMLGVGIAEESGLISAALRRAVQAAPRRLITPVIVFLGVMSNVATDAGYVVLIPLGALVFRACGRHPLAGLAAAFAGVSGGFSANLIVGALDPMFAGITQAAAQMVDPDYQVSAACNWYFLIASTFLITILGTVITDKVVEPRLGPWEERGEEGLPDALGNRERRALRRAGLTALLFVLAVALLCLPKDSFLRNENGQLVGSPASPLLDGVIVLIALLFFLPGVVYGRAAGTLRGERAVCEALGRTMASMGSYVALAFVAAQFIEYFSYTRLGTILAIRGADFFRSAGVGLIPMMLLFVLFSAFLNLFMGSASAKWNILAPVFVPMFMLLDYTPELAQLAYRIGDSCTNIITPLMSYYAVIVSYARRYDRKAGIGTLTATMLPYSLCFLVFWSLLLVAWLLLGWPIGPGAGIRL